MDETSEKRTKGAKATHVKATHDTSCSSCCGEPEVVAARPKTKKPVNRAVSLYHQEAKSATIVTASNGDSTTTLTSSVNTSATLQARVNFISIKNRSIDECAPPKKGVVKRSFSLKSDQERPCLLGSNLPFDSSENRKTSKKTYIYINIYLMYKNSN